jgi:aminoglycoside 2''-phosphotransferase
MTDGKEVKPLLETILKIYPHFGPTSARFVKGHGQNNQILIVSERWVFRSPHYAEGAERLTRTVEILRALRGTLPLRIPDPVMVHVDSKSADKVFVGYPLIEGEPLWSRAFEQLPDEALRQRVVDQLTGFLKALHDYPIGGLFHDEVAVFDPLVQWRDLYERIRTRLFSAMRPDAREATSRHFETFLDDHRNQSIRPALTHGDFGTSNILYDPATRTVLGVIDFDSAGIGDPAVDLAAASCYGLDRFARVYPEVTAMVSRIDFYRGTFALQEALFGFENRDDAAYQAGLAVYV